MHRGYGTVRYGRGEVRRGRGVGASKGQQKPQVSHLTFYTLSVTNFLKLQNDSFCCRNSSSAAPTLPQLLTMSPQLLHRIGAAFREAIKVWRNPPIIILENPLVLISTWVLIT